MATAADLSTRHALVTGAGRGIGRAVAERLASAGAALTLVARSADELEFAREACEAAGASTVAVELADLTDREHVEMLCTTVAPSVDVLVNNAGSAPSAPLERTDDDLFDEVLELNVRAPFALARVALPPMGSRGWGRVVNVASTAALEGFAYTSAYVTSKHGLLGLTRALAAEAAARWKDADLTVNAVCPGFVDTAIVADAADRIAASSDFSADEARERMAAMNPGGRLLAPNEVADRIVALIAESPGTTRGQAVTLG